MKKPTGRPSSFKQQTADIICERIATTPRGLDFICNADDALPCAKTVHEWLNAYPSFLQSYLRARERQADLIFDQCLEIADDASGDHDEDENLIGEAIQRAKLRVDTRMRMAGKLAPKKYGDKVAVVGGAERDSPVQTKSEVTVKFIRP